MKNKFVKILAVFLTASLISGCGAAGSTSQGSAKSPSATASNSIDKEVKEDGEADPEDSEEPKADESSEETEIAASEAPQDNSSAGVDSASSPAAEEDEDEDVVVNRFTNFESESIGNVFFSPNQNSKTGLIPRGGNTLHAYFERPNVIGNGKIYIYDTTGVLFTEVDLAKEKYCHPVNDDGTLKMLDWEGGTHLEIKLPKYYVDSNNFYVLMDKGAFVTSDGKIASREVTDKKTWRYDVQNFGVELFVKNGGKVYVGDEVFIKVLIRNPAYKAIIDNYDENRLGFNEKEFKNEDGDLKVRIKQLGEDTFHIYFYEKESKELIADLPITYYAEMRPDPEEEEIQSNIVGL